MTRRWTPSLLIAIATSSLLVLGAACSDEESKAGDDEPIVPTRCAIYWARESPIDGGETLDVFAVDQPVAAWVSGAGDYGGVGINVREGLFAYRTPDGSFTAAAGLGRVTSGDFSLVVAGTNAGDTVQFTDGTAQLLVDARTAGDAPSVGTGGVGSFDGVWSDPAADTSAEIDWANGTLTVTYLGSSITMGGTELGGMSAYGQCYDPAQISTFAPVLPDGGRIFYDVQLLRSGTRNGKASR